MSGEGPSSPATHLAIEPRLSGEPVVLEAGRATVRLTPGEELAADERGLVHGGFLFSAADYCAMLAVNEPNVVLAGAEMRFLAPVVVGETVLARGRAEATGERRFRVDVEVVREMDDAVVARGIFDCVVTARHVLESRP